ncbi:MAG: type II toxin-antitoxin system HicB family antitoxin [Symploca sp. SIO2C1]|nr:type II toxin-antitoxin system HicB family antitoxin [Symploca sp. SIO2C1]
MQVFPYSAATPAQLWSNQESAAFADNPESALEELHTAWEGVKESYKKHGEPIPVAPANKNYSGQFNVRIDKRLHKVLAMEAAQAGISLNALISQKLVRGHEDSLQ